MEENQCFGLENLGENEIELYRKKSGEDKTKPNHNLRQYLEQKRCGEG
jgi:hypothetical protein